MDSGGGLAAACSVTLIGKERSFEFFARLFQVRGSMVVSISKWRFSSKTIRKDDTNKSRSVDKFGFQRHAARPGFQGLVNATRFAERSCDSVCSWNSDMPKNRRFSDCPKVAAKPSSADWNILVHLPGVPAHFRTDGRLALSTAAQNSTPHKRSRGPVCCCRGNIHVNGHRDGRVKVCGTRRISPQTLTADAIVQVLRGDTQAIAVLEVCLEPTQDQSTDAARCCLVETPVSLPSCSHNATCATTGAEGANGACNRVQQFAVHKQDVLIFFLRRDESRRHRWQFVVRQ